jgi:hypothetical protein
MEKKSGKKISMTYEQEEKNLIFLSWAASGGDYCRALPIVSLVSNGAPLVSNGA